MSTTVTYNTHKKIRVKKKYRPHTEMTNNDRQAQKSCSLLSLYKKAMLSAAFFCGGVVVDLE